MPRQRSIFDIVGPVMIGPSSSHTAGAVRLGLLARSILGEQPVRAEIGLHGSFASTGKGHGTDLAIVAGLLGFAPDDPAIRDSLLLASDAGLETSFHAADLGQTHPNSAAFALTAADGRRMELQGSSLGGGDVVLTRIDGYDTEITGELPSLLVFHLDRPGEVAAVTAILAREGVNIARMRVSRERRGADALMVIETDAPAAPEAIERIAAAPGIIRVRAVSAV